MKYVDFQRGDKYSLAALLKGKVALEDTMFYNKLGYFPP
ncbi:MAG: hypothetical protein DDT21_01288 [Syntrophomonadaceae bacterium]|nr:hypothetical protein [Bacillota bacterium]